MTVSSIQGENTQPPPSSRSEKIDVIKIQTIKRSQITNSEETRLFSKMLMIGQLKKRTPRTNKNIQTSLLMGIPLSVSFPPRARITGRSEIAIPPAWSDDEGSS
jgi:hypothetical protein